MPNPLNSPSTRRQVLKLLAGVPMVPLGAGSALHFAGGVAAAPPAGPWINLLASVAFSSMPAPTLADAAAMARVTVGSSLTLTRQDGRQHSQALAYWPLFMTGDAVPDGSGGTLVAGGCFDVKSRPIIDKSVAGQERQFFSDCPDGTSLLQLEQPKVAGIKGRALFAVVQFEYVSRDQANAATALPSPLAVLTLDQDPTTGLLRLVKYHNVATASAKGLWTTCAASLSPWNTHLSSEEYPPDAFTVAENRRFKAFSQNYFGDASLANPYHYGHVPEVTVMPDGSASVVKHFCLGRISREVAQVMPDQRTVLMGDDYSNAGLFMFVADQVANLSAGTLYAAKWQQTSGLGAGSARLSWVKLGHASSSDIEALANRLQGTDIMEVKTDDPLEGGFTRIGFAGKTNWVKLKAGMEQAAAFLETHRFAALKGASLGFTKMEGVTVNVRDKVAYCAMSYIHGSMVDGSSDIKVQGPRAGAVYALTLTGTQRDSTGEPIDSDWVAVDMAPLAALVGQDLALPDALGNLAQADKIANPDNLKFSETMRTLFIGEDSGLHVNNFLWAYHLDSRRLSRILSCPAGAECTGLHVVDDLNGWSYVMSHFQHPGAWGRALHSQVQAILDPLVRANYKDRFGAQVGYLGTATSAIKLG